MTGPSGGVKVGASVALSLGRPARHPDLEAALMASGFDVVSVDGIPQIHDVVGSQQPFVAVVDDSTSRWLREVSDLLRIRPRARVLAVVQIDSAEEFLTALTAGVAGFVAPNADVPAVVRSIEALCDDGVAIPRGMVSALVDVVRHGRGRSLQTAAGRVDVTDREWEILELLLEGRSTREMAQTLFISVGTVRSHVSTLLRKLGAVDRDDVIRLIRRTSR